MRIIEKMYVIVLLSFLLLICQSVLSVVILPVLVSDGMVLQRGDSTRIWGWADAGENITVSFINNTYTTTADKQGNWSVILSGLKAGGPYDMDISAGNEITIRNILIGDVWLCSGQSNMGFPMKRTLDLYKEEIENSENIYIREFKVPMRYDFNTPQDDMKSGEWKSSNPENILNFAAVPYFFAKALYDKYHVPVGLINASVGGTPIEAWLSENVLKDFPEHMKEAEKFRDNSYIDKILTEDRLLRNEWHTRIRKLDKGFSEKNNPWFDEKYDASGWQTIQLPSFWKDEGLDPVNGVVWFRKKIDIPEPMAGKPGKLFLGRIVDSDSAYVNGRFVGSVSYQYPPRIYDIPENLLKEGKNIIVVRVISNSGHGGFIKDKPYHLVSGDHIIDLKGEWQYKIGAVMEPLPDQPFIHYKPLGLYNGMISPALNYDIKGIIWYQGESNADRPVEYRQLLPALINDWREKWNKPECPFLYVQLPNFKKTCDKPSESNWALFREAQLKTLNLPNTAMAVAIDLGEWNDIHPLNKKDVGMRLALAAMNKAYMDKDVVFSGPVYKSIKTEGNKIIITFTNTGEGLTVKGGGELKYFAIAGRDRKFVWANAKIMNNKVIVWHKDIPKPAAVRYAWADNPEGANLYNIEGLPASPFRTDDY